MEQTATPAEASVRQLVTAEELIAISQDDTHRYELIQGEVIVMSPAGHHHGKLASRLHIAIGVFVQEHTLGETYAAETGYRLTHNPDTVLAPDISLVLSTNLTDDRIAGTLMLGAPDLVVEVISPSDTLARTAVKVQIWLRHGAQLVWVVEPETQTVTVYRADGTVALLKAADTLDGEQLLPGFALPLEQLFR